PASATTPTGKFAGLPSSKSGSCQAVLDNFKQGAYPQVSPTLSLSSFYTSACKLTDETLRLGLGTMIATDHHKIYLCPLMAPVLGPLSPAVAAERTLCYDPDDAGAMLLESRRFGDSALDVSGDLECGDGRVPHGVDLVGHADRARLAGTPKLVTAAMVKACMSELNEKPQAAFTGTGETAVSQAYRALYADHACFSPGHFYSALKTLTDAPSGIEAGGARLFMRLLSQWVTLHGFLTKEGGQADSLAQVLASAVDLDPEDAAATSETADLGALLDEQEKGWNLVLAHAHSAKLFTIPAASVLSPDYRSTGTTTKPEHDQNVGIPVTLLEGATLHLQLAERYLDQAALSAYSECHDGTASGTRDQALARLGRVLRYTMSVEALAQGLYDYTTATLCWGSCPAGAGTCGPAGRCADPKTGEWIRTSTTWQDLWRKSQAEFQAIRERLVRQGDAIASCRSPLGFEERATPIFFGDVTGSSSRFFASSDYLLYGWAAPAVQAALASLGEARSAWLQRRSSEIQEDDADERRVDLAEQYGRELNALCGLYHIEPKDTLAALGEGPGQIPPASCFVDRRNSFCTVDPAKIYSLATEDDVRFELCYWHNVKNYTFFLSDDDRTMAASWTTATFDKTSQTVTSGGITKSIQYLYEEAYWPRQNHTSGARNALATCAADPAFGGVEHSLPTPVDGDPSILDRSDCYRGQLGEAFLGVTGAQTDVELAISNWNDSQERYENEMDHCLELEKEFAHYKDLLAAHQSHMAALRNAKKEAEAKSSLFGSWSKMLVGAFTGNPGMAIGGLVDGVMASGIFGDSAEDIAEEMELAEQKFRDMEKLRSEEMNVKECYHRADQYKVGIDTEALKIQRALIEAAISENRYRDMIDRVRQLLLEGNAAMARDAGRRVPSLLFHYWLDERVDRFEKDFQWARSLTYLAMRAVEYEFQQSVPLRGQILTAGHPDQLLDAIRAMEREQITRTINSRRPEEGILVLSLRSEILGLRDQASSVPGERLWTSRERFQHRLWSEAYAVYDDNGTYLGQGIPFTLAETGPLELRCAEKLWRVTATIQGDQLGEDAPAAPLFLMKRNHFSSQWCKGRGDGTPVQTGSMQPVSRLFHPDDRGGSEAAVLEKTTAMLYPWFNVRRSDFYRRGYEEGASEELAGRGLYGDYVLLFPWKGLLEPKHGSLGFPLEQVEDVLLRFDYLSVDDI
ncbi:MAG: hypothetical protein HY698_15545, partial [Deltaproteobacteria bacterium]|nr:hypothetical protein [Deltaproteobacteria bacterium]